ncbi:hypothetical protein CSA56_07565 [candidate division KSB3 bacterium]|uniref:Uncharacterized protein n=1 Tax=candidate division KSB3 bacterium TaxID=2044937 RepID=A0A2G6KFP5_9BACT|nr:MAG: hypothetical protein CSA56_07565 [candidate division KSB3 bacterium]
MEEFIDFILIAILIIVIAFSGLLIFLLRYNPSMAYWLSAVTFSGLVIGSGLLIRKIYRKKLLGEYYDLFQECSRLSKAIAHSTKRLERHTRKNIRGQLPKIHTLCRKTRKRLKQLVEIDNTLHTFEQQEPSGSTHTSSATSQNQYTAEKISASSKLYRENIKKIERSKQQYLQDVQQVIRFLHELHSQILALRYSQQKGGIHIQIAETIDELLIDMQTLEEMSQ